MYVKPMLVFAPMYIIPAFLLIHLRDTFFTFDICVILYVLGVHVYQY